MHHRSTGYSTNPFSRHFLGNNVVEIERKGETRLDISASSTIVSRNNYNWATGWWLVKSSVAGPNHIWTAQLTARTFTPLNIRWSGNLRLCLMSLPRPAQCALDSNIRFTFTRCRIVKGWFIGRSYSSVTRFDHGIKSRILCLLFIVWFELTSWQLSTVCVQLRYLWKFDQTQKIWTNLVGFAPNIDVDKMLVDILFIISSLYQ